MKTTLLILLFVFIAGAVNAQITKGSKLIGGNVSFASSEEKSGFQPNSFKSSSVYFYPSFGMAVKENLIAGIKLGYGRFVNNQETGQIESKQKTNSYSAGVFIRKYKQLGKSDFYLFGDADLNYQYANTVYKNEGLETSDRKNHQLDIGITPGLSYAVNKRLHLELSVGDLFSAGFVTDKETNSTATRFKRNGTFVSTNIASISNSLSFGLRFLLAKL